MFGPLRYEDSLGRRRVQGAEGLHATQDSLLQETIASDVVGTRIQEYPVAFGQSIFEWWSHNKRYLRSAGY